MSTTQVMIALSLYLFLGCCYSDPIKVNFNLSPVHPKRNLVETLCSICLDFNKRKIFFSNRKSFQHITHCK